MFPDENQFKRIRAMHEAQMRAEGYDPEDPDLTNVLRDKAIDHMADLAKRFSGDSMDEKLARGIIGAFTTLLNVVADSDIDQANPFYMSLAMRYAFQGSEVTNALNALADLEGR